MITTNGRVNNPFAAKGTCPNAGNWIHTQLPTPDCGPDGSIMLCGMRWEAGCRLVPSLHERPWQEAPNLDPFGNLLALRPKSSLLPRLKKLS